jgi:hypothetical protein
MEHETQQNIGHTSPRYTNQYTNHAATKGNPSPTARTTPPNPNTQGQATNQRTEEVHETLTQNRVELTANNEGTNKKRTKATMKIASLNMRGRGTDKWNNINQLIREKKIGILAIQESHLSDVHVEQLHKLFHKRMKILHSIDPQRPNAMGVAVVLNKEIMNTQNTKMQVIILGRAILIQPPWHTEQIVTI